MGLFDFFKSKKKAGRTIVSNWSTYDSSIYSDTYFKLLEQQPNLADYFGRSFDYPKYTDAYVTNDGFKLRELLLLVWWGKTKNGRKNSVAIPKYFFMLYNLSGDRLTKEFFSKELLLNDGDKIKLTDKGKELFNQYKDLWEIHSAKGYPSNLDVDFPDWNAKRFNINYYKANIAYLKDYANYSSKMIDFFNSNPRMEDIGNQKEFHQSNRSSCIMQANDFEQKLNILLEDYLID